MCIKYTEGYIPKCSQCFLLGDKTKIDFRMSSPQLIYVFYIVPKYSTLSGYSFCFRRKHNKRSDI